MGINNNDISNGLVEKLDQINENQTFIEYIYYAFEFPVLRNEIAHGNIIDISDEIAYDTLMDVSFLFSQIESNHNEYKEILKFLEEFSDKEINEGVTYILSYFSGPLKMSEKLRWLQKCLEGKYDKMIAWYNRTDKFSSLIYNYEPLEISKYAEFQGEKFQIKNINIKLMNYIPILRLLENYMKFPQQWRTDVEQRCRDIDEEQKKQIKLQNELISNLSTLKTIKIETKLFRLV